MRKIIFLIFIMLEYNLPAQTIIPENQNINIEDQIFVQTDRNKYQPGDTIFFQSYIRDRLSGSFESSSSALYAILYDDLGQVADSSRFRIINATSPGWLVIPANTKSGIYHFVAFTSMMQNFDPSDAFHLDLSVEMTGSQILNTSSKNSNIPFFKDLLNLKFLPEGGNLISGLDQVIGFNAVDRYGVPVEIEGLLKKINGVVLDTVKSGPYGPGKFTCVPEDGMYLELIKGAGDQKIWPLPTPDISGISLSINPVDQRTFAIEVQSNNYNGDTILLSGTMNFQQIFEKEFSINQRQHFVIKTDDLPSGIAVITLSDKNLLPVAERLTAINTDERLRISIEKNQDDFVLGQEAELEINVTGRDGEPMEGIFSISVADSASGYDPGLFLPGIEYIFNYNPFFRNNLPSGVLKKGLQNLTDDQLDLILMTYGWCKFNRNFNQVTANKELINYDQLKLKLNYISDKHRDEGNLDLISLEGPIVMHLKTNETGEVSIPLDSLPENVRSVTLMPGKIRSNKIRGAMLSIPFNEQFLKDKSFFTSQQIVNYERTEKDSLIKPVIIDQSNIPVSKSWITGKTFELPPVNISANKKIEYLNKYEEIYKYANVKSMSGEKVNKYITLSQTIRNIMPAATIVEPPYPPGIYFRQSHSFFGGNVKAMIVLDGMPLIDGWAQVRTLPTIQISSISVLDGNQGHIIYGENAYGGVVFINTRESGPANFQMDWKSQNSRNNLLTPINIFRQNAEFYNPSGSEIEDNPVFRDRATVYWNPEVYFDGKNPVKIRYINPKRDSKMEIIINGVSSDNLFGTAIESYSVSR